MKKLISAMVAVVMIVSCFASMNFISYAATSTNEANVQDYVFTVANTASDNLFRYKFVLLDTDSNNDSSRFFVLGAGNYGAGPVHNAGDNSFSWDPTDKATLSGYLNRVWLEETGVSTSKLPTGTGTQKKNITLYTNVKTYIDRRHTWAMSDDSTITCGVTALSEDEYKAYSGRIDYKGDNATDHASRNWLLRTKSNSETSPARVVKIADGTLTDATTTGTVGFRPCFWLGVDFFKKVKLDLTNTGSEVIKAIKANYSRTDLAEAGYTEDELDSIFITLDNTLTTIVTVDGTTKPGYTLAVSHDTLPDGAEATYQWQQADAAVGPFTDITGATEDTYTLKNAQGGKYVRVMVKLTKDEGTTVGPDTYSDAVQVAAALTPGAPDVSNATTTQVAVNTTYRLTIPEEVEGMEEMNETSRSYFLLDDTGSDDAKFLLIEAASVAKLEKDATQGVNYNAEAANNKFDPDVANSLAYWLKNTYAEGEATVSSPVGGILYENKLAPAFIPYLDTEHEWLTEGAGSGDYCPDDYVVKAPAAILSITEFKQYKDRFGWAEGLDEPTGDPNLNMFRTPREKNAKVRLGWRTNHKTGTTAGGGIIVANAADANSGAEMYIRPVFWLKKDVFRNVKIDVETMGSGVKKMLRETYTKAELAKIYDAEELAAIGFESVSVDSVLLSGIPTVGSELEVNYNYSSSNPDADVNVSIQWMYSNTPDDGYTNIPGATSKKYIIDSAYNGKYIKAKVTPLDSNDNEGEPVMSNHLGLVGSVRPITITNPVYAQDGADYKVTFTISNTGSTTPVYVIIAAYRTSDNVMVRVNPQEVSVANGTADYSAVLENFTKDDDTIVRGFVWNNLTDMIPLY